MCMFSALEIESKCFSFFYRFIFFWFCCSLLHSHVYSYSNTDCRVPLLVIFSFVVVPSFFTFISFFAAAGGDALEMKINSKSLWRLKTSRENLLGRICGKKWTWNSTKSNKIYFLFFFPCRRTSKNRKLKDSHCSNTWQNWFFGFVSCSRYCLTIHDVELSTTHDSNSNPKVNLNS